MVRECLHCGTDLDLLKDYREKFCSLICKRTFYHLKGTEEFRCPVCFKITRIKKSRIKHRKTCSLKCAGESRRRRVTMRCVLCNKKYEIRASRRVRRKYCSMECVRKSQLKVLNPPNKVQLSHLVLKSTVPEIALMYEVSSAVVYNWCKRLGVCLPTRKERADMKNHSNKGSVRLPGE